MNITTAIASTIGIVAVTTIGGLVFYSNSLKADLAISVANEIKLESSVEKQKNTIARMESDFKKIQTINEKLNETTKAQIEQINTLNKKFNIKANGKSRDFGAISRARPTTITKIINKATRNVNRCFEIATGAVINEGEKNNECKNLVSPPN